MIHNEEKIQSIKTRPAVTHLMELDKDIKAVIIFVFYMFTVLRPGV